MDPAVCEPNDIIISGQVPEHGVAIVCARAAWTRAVPGMGPPLDSASGQECEQAPALAVMTKKKVAAALATLSPEERADTLEEIEAEKQEHFLVRWAGAFGWGAYL